VLLYLAVLTGNEDYSRRATTVFRLLREPLERYGAAFGRLLCALDFHLSSPREIAVIGESDSPETRALLREIWSRYLPNKIVVQAPEGDARAAEAVPLLRERPMLKGRSTAYVCENYTCRSPVTSPAELAGQLSAVGARDASSSA
jgi:hypothetical protein